VIGFVHIDKCTDRRWYQKLVGQEYAVYADEGVEWLTYQPDGYTNFILKSDATLLNNNDTQVVLESNQNNQHPTNQGE
jgi:hypothetical protein